VRSGCQVNNNELLQHYEKLYTHEINAREHLNARLQLPLAIIVSFFGALFYLIQNYEHKTFKLVSSAYVCLLILTAGALIVATYFFKRAAHDNKYEFMPAADVIEPHRLELQKHYALHPRLDGQSIDEFEAYLIEHYIKYSSLNTRCNDGRSLSLHHTNSAIIAAGALGAIAFLVFYFGKLEKVPEIKTTSVQIVSPIQLKGIIVAEPQPAPPPPQPPPARIVRNNPGVPSPLTNPPRAGESK
jgi:hypothetical protein